jgi:hypothetical protein
MSTKDPKKAQKIAEKAVKNAGGRKIGPKRFSAVKAVKKLKKERKDKK